MKIIKKQLNILNPYIIVIPTFAREKIIFQRTLKTLYECNIKSDYIYLFLASNDEYKKYLDTYNNLENIKYKNWLLKCKCVIGVIGLSNQRNFISKFFKEGQYILQIDDDIQDIYFLKYNINDIKNRKQWILNSFKNKTLLNKNKTLKQYGGLIKSKYKLKTKKTNLDNKNNITKIKFPKTLHKLIIDAFDYCYKKDIYIWGVYPIENAYFMNPDPSTKLKFIVGPCFGIINRHLKNLELTIDEKENVERTLQYWTNDGIVLRLNNICVKTQYYKVPGGMQSYNKDRKQEALKSAEYLHSKYPNNTKIYLGKKSGYPEIKLINSNLKLNK